MSYFETSKDIVSEIDIEKLAQYPQGERVGRLGSGYQFRQLGQLSIGNTPEAYVGLKTSLFDAGQAEARLIGEMAFIELLLENSSELAPRIPSFMALLALEGSSEPIGILTDDASCGGQKSIVAMQTSNGVLESICTAFQSLGKPNEILSEANCGSSLSFDVDNTELLLDFTPPPIRQTLLAHFDDFQEIYREVSMRRAEVFITIPRISSLGQSLAA